MTTPQPLRFETEPNTNTVIDRQTGERHPCDTLLAMMRLRSELEVAAMPVVVVTARKRDRLQAIEERKQGGQR